MTRHEYTTEARELRELLWRAVAASSASHLITPPGLVTPPAPPPPPAHTDPRKLSRDQVVHVLARCGGVRERAWRELGLRSRDQLKRLLKRHGLA
ncbi:nitrogen fixation protein NifQ [Nannocystis sp. RBIL2]|uniref:nitrogen fixation protein NifQ n=1 Tax=Nannocystis sp. RBIL2 TaxID=2996788 RepID=UPI0022701BEB|nr:nitrogen fixation protein NifQ [Nannocystis sp. RBIL2]MCY1065144.1 nitrogen fixation protein NifQ [Nannocystis sp. RBIL2]